MLSKLALAADPFAWDETASPTRNCDPIVMVWVPPTCVQVVPLLERYAVKDVPRLLIFTQIGPLPLAVSLVEVPPEVRRRWKDTPLL